MTDQTPVSPANGGAPASAENAPATEAKQEANGSDPQGTEPPADVDYKAQYETMSKEVKRLKEQTERQRGANRSLQQRYDEISKKIPKPQEPVAPEKPKRDMFQTQEEYESAIDKWSDDMAEFKAGKRATDAEQRQKRSEDHARQQQDLQERQKVQEAKAVEFAKSHPDFYEVQEIAMEIIETADRNSPAARAVRAGLLYANDLPAVSYYFGNNPNDLSALFDKAPRDILLEIGRIDAKLSNSSAAPTSDKPAQHNPTVKPIPAPPTQIRGNGAGPKSEEQMSGKELRAKYNV